MGLTSRLLKNSYLRRSRASPARATIHYAVFALRLEATPLQNQPANVFPQLARSSSNQKLNPVAQTAARMRRPVILNFVLLL
jgi:hypothetical protein